MRAILEAVFDRGSVFELGARYGRSLIAALARLDGRPVGVLASDPKHYGGGLTGDASDKLVRFVDLCDQFRLPVVNLVDQPGFVIGTEAERAGTMRRGARALFAVYQATVPWVSVLVRKVYGVAGAGARRRTRGSTSATRGRRATGARCRSRAGSRPPTGASSRRPRTRSRCAPRSRRGSTRCARRSAPPSASASRRSSTRATRARCCASGRARLTGSSPTRRAAGPKARGPRP